MAIFVHRYTLRSRGELNAVSRRREFHGALIKVDEGIGCLHPWPEFGDAPIEEQLQLLRDGGSSKVIECALRMAAVDGEARSRGVSLFAGLEIPPSHFSWDHHQPPGLQMKRVSSEGWQAIKMKGSANFGETITAINAPIAWWYKEQDLPSPGRKDRGTWQVPLLDAPRLRVDFNSCLTEEQFRRFLDQLSLESGRLDFIEDPFPYDSDRWQAIRRDHKIRLALDKQLKGAVGGFDVAVMKPGRREWRDILPNLPSEANVVMTSAMDHAIGQCFAAYEAALAWKELGDRMDLCGLCTEHLFERDEFFERLVSHGGKLMVDRTGTGLGFDDILAKLPWRALRESKP